MAAKLNQKLDEAQREELTRRALAAETPKNLAAEFSVTPAYVAVLKARGVAKLREENGGVLLDESSFQTGNRRLTKAQREEVTRRVLAGEKSPGLAREFGVSRAYVSLLKNMALKPEQFSSHEKLTKKLTATEIEEFHKILSTTTPTDHDFRPHSEKWSLEYGAQLAQKLFKKSPSRRSIGEIVTPYVPKRGSFRFGRPQPPKPHHINQLSAEFANDPDFVAYYLSPICQQIAQREYEMALADYEKRFAAADEREAAAEARLAAIQQGSRVEPPAKRTGKHAMEKGSPFTAPKRRKKR